MNFLNKRAFTLIEILISIVVITLVATASFTAVTILTSSGEISRNRSMATNLLQKSQEEVRRIAQVDAVYEDLQSCQFPNPLNPPINTCGLSDTSTDFFEFSRTLEVTRESDSTELKRVLTTVNWIEEGNPRQLQSLMFLSRPPDSLPGNILGLVSSENTPSDPLGGILVTVSQIGVTQFSSTSSASSLGPEEENFNFADVDTGRLLLAAGTYEVTVNEDGFFPFMTTVNVPSEGQRFVNIVLEPRPEKAIIFGNVVHKDTRGVLPTFNRGEIKLYQDSIEINRIDDQRTYSFDIDFDDTNSQDFTVNTNDAFQVGYALQVNSAGAPSCTHAFNQEGYSTSILQDDDATLTCNNPFNGDASSDRITVNPGDNIRRDLLLDPVPEVRITGRVVDSNTNPIANATLRARWPQGSDWRKDGNLQTTSSNADGTFTFSVPATQGLFSNNFGNYLRVWARGEVQVFSCCNVLQTETRNSNTLPVGPLFPGDPTRNIGDLIIDNTDEDCGNVDGTVTNDKFGGTVSSVAVNISASTSTNGIGQYVIECPSPDAGYRIEVGAHRSSFNKSGFYHNDSNGNLQYSRRGPNGLDVNILIDQQITHDARLWPQGFGNIVVTVLDLLTGAPIDGVEVVFNPYTGSNVVRITVGGVAQFSSVLETWPPLGIPTDSYYKHTAIRNHEISINPDEAIYQPQSVTVSNFNAGDNLNITIQLRRQGGL